MFAGFGKLQTHSRWLGWALTYGFLLAVGVGLVVVLLRLERRWRVRLVPESDGPAPGAASARDWQLWLADARQAAAGAGHGARRSIFFTGRRFRGWNRSGFGPRTGRERRANTWRWWPGKIRGGLPLAALTGDFERIWYGGRAAGEGDYRRAEEAAARLIGAAAVDGQGSGR